MNITDIVKNVNTYISDSSTDRLSADERYQAITEATTWLLEELGNEHMTDRAEIEYLPSVMWYKMDAITPYLLTAGQLRFKEEAGDRVSITRVEARDLATMPKDRTAYAIERFNGDGYLGINLPYSSNSLNDSGCATDIIPFNTNDEYTYTGINATNIQKEAHDVSFDMDAFGQTSTGIETTITGVDLTNYEGLGRLIFEVEIPDIEDVTSVSLRFGTDLSTDYYLGTVDQDINGNALIAGVNTLKIKWTDLTTVGSPTITALTEWRITINHSSGKAITGPFKISDLRIAKPIYLNFKYVFYRVGKSTTGADIIEFTADTDVPFFAERYPQYRYAVAHKAAAVLYRSMVMEEKASDEERQATTALRRFRKNFSGERDMANSAFKVAGVSFRNRRVIRRR